jgi:glycosyltransferase involved in cell wall biosynthesis
MINHRSNSRLADSFDDLIARANSTHNTLTDFVLIGANPVTEYTVFTKFFANCYATAIRRTFTARRKAGEGTLPLKARVVFLASAWGPRHGGINSFNLDLIISFAKVVRDSSVECICFTSDRPTSADASEASAHRIKLDSIDVANPAHWTRYDADRINEHPLLKDRRDLTLCVGHDAITGEAAVALASCCGGRSVVINHMSYVDYIGFKSSKSETLRTKQDLQRKVFNAADFRFSVGPSLQHSLAELIGAKDHTITALIPGLADIHISSKRSDSVRAIIFGRLDDENERIKQGRLALSAIGSAIKQARNQHTPSALIQSPRITLIGINPEQERSLQQLAESKAGGVVNLIFRPFLDRQALFEELAVSNLALFTSWHEGFGLAAWEAIGAEVPLITGQNTGVYYFLNTQFSGAESGFVRAVDIKGALSQRQGGHFRPEDESAVREAVLFLARDLASAQERAHLLRLQLTKFTWTRTAYEFANALGLEKYVKRLIKPEVLEQPEVGPAVLADRASGSSVCETGEAASLLLLKARLSYGRGNYGLVFATSISAADTFESCGLYTDALASLVEAISASRPERKGDKLRAVIMRAYRLCAQYPIGLAERWLFLDRFALVLFDYGNFSQAAQVIVASEDLFKRLSPGVGNPQRLAFDSSNSFRRRVVIKASDGMLGTAGRLNDALDELNERSAQFLADRQFNSFATNLDVASKLAAEVKGDVELAHSFSTQALERRPDIDHWWVLQEHLWREAEYYKFRGDNEGLLKVVSDALGINQKSPVLLEPVAGKPGQSRGDLRRMLQRLGINPLDLAERGLRVNQLIATPLRLSDGMIEQIVKAATK